MKKTLIAVAALVAANANAASSYNFDSNNVNDFFTTSVTGWTQSQPNHSSTGSEIPFAYIQDIAWSDTVTSRAGYFGTRRVGLPAAAFPTNTLTGDLTGAGAVSGSTVSLNAAILLTGTPMDGFGIGVTGDSGSLVTLVFTPDTGNPGNWILGYSVGGGSTTSTLSTFEANAGYSLFFSFLDDSIRISYGEYGSSTSFDIANISTGIAAGATYSGIEIIHDPQADNANNAIVFDNILVAPIPEPSTALLLGVASVALLRRRRN